ncbi:alpha/beta fold hydrolase [Sphingomonas sp. IC-56]|uniref:alpha/beta fold hydrolase n=1 Tax=Sphingomonas sp. IC-56 TaxID=2898529 RepID=UPI001E6540A1|nr:alpha/beta fold hydrolase [Sphingomonas sp. IC-56]MCD2324601.1 alpha/beta fold hydrolase [Sphingomonas sp. IC-56]
MPLFLALLRDETAASPERRAAALAGLRRYQTAPRPAPRPPKPAIAASGRARLRDYGGTGRPVVFVPSLINPPQVLDLARGNSLLRWLSRQGVRPMLVDWGTPTPAERDMDVTAHVERLLLPMLRSLPRPPVLVGYCLGGTLAIAAASVTETAGLATIAAPWHFRAYGEATQSAAALWAQARRPSRQLGLMPMEVLQAGFWQLDPARTVAKFERFGRLPPSSAAARAFVVLEDWANGGAPLTWATGRQLFDDFFTADLPGTGAWQVEGRSVDPRALSCPTLAFVSTTDRIVPAASAPSAGTVFESALGHVGMVVGSRGRTALWQPLADWLTALPASR